MIKKNKLDVLVRDYDLKVRRIKILKNELERLKSETRSLFDEMERSI